MINKNYTYLLCSVTKEQSLLFFTEDLSMAGGSKTSTLDAMVKALLCPCLRIKMGTASVATPKLSGHLPMRWLVIVVPCSSTSHSKGASQSNSQQSMRFGVIVTRDLHLMEVINGSYVQMMSHLMVMEIAYQLQISLVMR
jgi:hypothetical protein